MTCPHCGETMHWTGHRYVCRECERERVETPIANADAAGVAVIIAATIVAAFLLSLWIGP